jgi:hypothetical protein
MVAKRMVETSCMTDLHQRSALRAARQYVTMRHARQGRSPVVTILRRGVALSDPLAPDRARFLQAEALTAEALALLGCAPDLADKLAEAAQDDLAEANPALLLAHACRLWRGPPG